MKIMIYLLILLLIVICLIVFYLFLIKPNTGRKSRMKPFEEVFIAHRGLFDNKTNAPENSLPAFRKAVQAGYGIELDIQLTKDHQMVVFHDASLKRMCGVDKILTDCTYKEIQQYTLAKSNEGIPLFEDILDIVDGKVPMVIEIKPEGDCIETARMLAKRMKSYKGIYCMESFHPGVVGWYRMHQPEVLRGQLSTNFKKNKISCTGLQHIVLSNLLLNFYAKPDFIAYNHKYADEFSYRLCRKLYDVENVAWTIRSQEQLEKAQEIFDAFIFDSFIPK